jgi:hypothetical protein
MSCSLISFVPQVWKMSALVWTSLAEACVVPDSVQMYMISVGLRMLQSCEEVQLSVLTSKGVLGRK